MRWTSFCPFQILEASTKRTSPRGPTELFTLTTNGLADGLDLHAVTRVSSEKRGRHTRHSSESHHSTSLPCSEGHIFSAAGNGGNYFGRDCQQSFAMTYLQGVFSLHAIFCYFYGGVTFFNTDLTVKMGLSRKLHTEPASPFLAQTRCLAALSEAPRLSSVRFTGQSISLTLPRPSLPSDPEWSGQQYTVLMKMHGACVLGLGLVCISAAQFDEAESRCGRSTTSHTPLASCRLHEDVHLLLCCNAAHRSPSPCPLPTYLP